MKTSRSTLTFTGTLLCAALGLSATQAQAGVIIQPAIVIGAPGVVVTTPPFVAYAPSPADVYITNAAPADVVFIHGDTFIWTVDGNGRRYQQFYAHGDHRADVFSRRDELHRVMARNGGRLPSHEAERHEGGNGRDQGGRPAENKDDHRN